MPDERPPRTIRMFPDYACSVLWIRDPINYLKSGLSTGLVAELQAWEQSYYDSLNDEIDWVSDAAARAFTEEGVRLARLVSAEVGPQFVVRFSSYETGAETVYSRAEQATENSNAESAFTSLFDEVDEDDRRIAEPVRSSPDGGWLAYAPLSDTVFTPNRQTENAPEED